MNERLLDYVEDAGVMHLGDNLSRHSPILLKLRVGDIPVRQPQATTPRPRKPAWYKATDDHIADYTSLLEEKLVNLDCPESLWCTDVHCSDPQHRQERDSHVLDLLVAMIESSHCAIPLTKPGQNKEKRVKNIPGWKQHVEPFRSDSMFWHSIWLSSGRPTSGELHRVMCWSRNKFHYAVRKLRKISENIRAEQLLEASEAGDIELMKAFKGKKGTCQTMPDSIEGKTEHHEILDKFKEVYEQLYNSAESKEAMNSIKEKLSNMINIGNSYSVINMITAEIVKEACGKMKAGKVDVSGSFTSEVLLHGPDELFVHIATVFRSFLVHGEITEQLLCCAFLPLFKGGLKDPAKTDSYRAIAGSSLLLKLFDNVVLLLWGHLLASDSLQFGYKSGTSTTQCTWLVSEVADYYQKRGTPIICVTLDCSKAFDKCKFDKLFEKLQARALPAVVIRVLIYVYEEQKAYVKLLDHRSDSFGITNGTRQGSVLSPALFSVYLDDLLEELRVLGVGCHVGGWWYGAACYADDLILLAPARTAAVMMLECCERYAEEHNLQFSTDPLPHKSKSKCIYFCGKLTKRRKPDPLTLLGQQLPWVASADHLGHVLHQSGTMDQDALVKRARFIDKTIGIRESFSFAYPDQIMRAVQVYACDGYGSMLYDFSTSSCESLFKSWNTCIKLIWGVPRSTFTYLVENVLASNFVSLRHQVYGRYVNYFHGLFKSSSKEVRHLVRIVSRDVRSTTCKNVMLLKAETGLSPWDYSKWRIQEKLRRASVPENDEWRPGLLLKLLENRRDAANKELLDKMIDSLCST